MQLEWSPKIKKRSRNLESIKEKKRTKEFILGLRGLLKHFKGQNDVEGEDRKTRRDKLYVTSQRSGLLKNRPSFLLRTSYHFNIFLTQFLWSVGLYLPTYRSSFERPSFPQVQKCRKCSGLTGRLTEIIKRETVVSITRHHINRQIDR